MILTLTHKRQEADDIWSFVFTPAEPLQWLAGQSIKIELEGQHGPTEHRFSIASAPAEKHIMITTRLSGSAYKKLLDSLKAGDRVNAYAVEGDFVWRDHTKPLLFVAAGIGITSFRSMLAQRVAMHLPIAATLIYGSPTMHLAFRDQLDAWHTEHPEFKVVHLIGQRLHVPFITQHATDLHDRLIYLSGPSAMVDELSQALQAHGVPKDHIIHDWFTGRLNDEG